MFGCTGQEGVSSMNTQENPHLQAEPLTPHKKGVVPYSFAQCKKGTPWQWYLLLVIPLKWHQIRKKQNLHLVVHSISKKVFVLLSLNLHFGARVCTSEARLYSIGQCRADDESKGGCQTFVSPEQRKRHTHTHPHKHPHTHIHTHTSQKTNTHTSQKTHTHTLTNTHLWTHTHSQKRT